ncbi:MAG: OmpP1/FadL family transporter [Muribaculaceae bacterium]
MKKFSLMLGALLVAASASAEGYQVNTLSARQLGMGHVGVALKLGAESEHFNPAGMAFMDKTVDISAGVTATSPFCTAETADGTKWETNNKVSTPLYLYSAFRIYDNLKVGVSLNTPYGSSINWTNDWAGAMLSQRVKLQTFSLQPTVAWRITDRIAVGAGLMIAWGSVDLDKGLVCGASTDLLLAAQGIDYRFESITPASVNLKGTAQVAFGYNVGVMVDVTKSLTIGASFRSKMTAKVKAGDARVSYANELAEQILESKIGLINSANFKAEMPMPYVLTMGASYKLNNRLMMAFDAQLTGWKAYRELNIEFLNEKLAGFNQNLTKNYHNAWAFRIGAQYALTNRLDLRAGIAYDRTPVDDNYYNPETPGKDKLSPSVGLSFRPIKNLSIDVACAYIASVGGGVKSYTYEDLILKQLAAMGMQMNPQQTFSARYNPIAWCPSIGIGYSF